LSSSELSRLAGELGAVADALGRGNRPVDVEQADLATLLAAAARLYTACAVDPYGQESLAALAVTPTDACTAAAALLRSQSISPFEFSIWFSGGRVGATK
jgi:hypothetical protein